MSATAVAAEEKPTERKAPAGPGGDATREKKKKETIMSDLAKFIDKRVRVKFQGGREAVGLLKGYDALVNVVLDDAVEYLRDPDDPQKLTNDHRPLGLIVGRGTALTVISPEDGTEQIANPFVTAE